MQVHDFIFIDYLQFNILPNPQNQGKYIDYFCFGELFPLDYKGKWYPIEEGVSIAKNGDNLLCQFQGSFFKNQSIEEDLKKARDFLKYGLRVYSWAQVNISRIDISENLRNPMKSYKLIKHKKQQMTKWYSNINNGDELTGIYVGKRDSRYFVRIYNKKHDPAKAHDIYRFGTDNFIRYEVQLNRDFIVNDNFDYLFMNNKLIEFINLCYRHYKTIKTKVQYIPYKELPKDTIKHYNFSEAKKKGNCTSYEMKAKIINGHWRNYVKNINDIYNILYLIDDMHFELLKQGFNEGYFEARKIQDKERLKNE